MAFHTQASDELTSTHYEKFLQDLKDLVKTSSTDQKGKFTESRKKEILGLLDKHVFEPVHVSETQAHRVFDSRFVDTVKNPGTEKV